MADLPLDVRRRPWKPKYITEETPMLNDWFVFGQYEDGTVGISDGQDDVMTHVPPDVAERIVSARRQFCAAIEQELCR